MFIYINIEYWPECFFKSSFRFQHISRFVLTFVSCIKTARLEISKFRRISKFMKRTAAIHKLPNISRSKDNQTINFGQLEAVHMEVSWPGRVGWLT